MNIILSILFAIKLFNPIPLVLPDLETSYNDVKNNYKVIECIDQDNRDCLVSFNYYVERRMPYETAYYFNEENKLIQISITFYNPVDERKIFEEQLIHLRNFDWQSSVITDENGNYVLHIWCCQRIISTTPPKKNEFIPKLTDLK